MNYSVVYSKGAERDFKRLDYIIRRRVIEKLERLANLSNSFAKAKKLQGFNSNMYRLRVDRIVFSDTTEISKGKTLLVLRIAHRKEVYR